MRSFVYIYAKEYFDALTVIACPNVLLASTFDETIKLGTHNDKDHEDCNNDDGKHWCVR